MARLPRGSQATLSDTASLRLRAAWLYYAHGLTQKDVADRLGIARSTVIRLLDEAMKRGEVRIWIDEGDRDCIQLALALEDRLGLDEAVVVPGVDGVDETAKSVGMALGKLLSDGLTDGITIGVGWGRTLTASLASFRPPRREGVRVVSLLGGVVEARVTNPVEYTWRLASQLGAECFFFPAPLLVDSADTRDRLMQRCGLDRIDRLATDLDIAILSVGDIGEEATSLSRALITADEARELVAAGCVCDAMCNFLGADGATIDHP
ncbi:MAG TPA: sugar-binding domain-containing protein, partial [Methylomirabilota bacterium]|nr:sugar-binding domain-containing protein [Methylomirabilota bacterium]